MKALPAGCAATAAGAAGVPGALEGHIHLSTHEAFERARHALVAA